MRTIVSSLLVVALATSIGCASVRKVLPERKERVEVDEVEELKQSIVELQRRATMAEVEVERLRRQVAELEGVEEQAGTVSAPSSSTEVPQYRGPQRPARDRSSAAVIEEAVLEVADLDAIETGVAAGPEIVETAPPPAAVVPMSAPAVPVDAGPATIAVSEEGQALYDRGYTLFHRGKYLDSETVFQQFLADFGATDLGDNAQFWIGEARYARRDLSGAMAAFREVVSRYPEGNKVPDAQLKVGDCQRGLGDIGGASKSYQEVVARFPFSAAAAVAEDRLRELP